jgi:hypothetical protein
MRKYLYFAAERDSPDVNRSKTSKWVNDDGEKIGQDKFLLPSYSIIDSPSRKKPEESRERRKETVQSHLKTKYDLMIVRKRKKASVSFTRSDAQM